MGCVSSHEFLSPIVTATSDGNTITAFSRVVTNCTSADSETALIRSRGWYVKPYFTTIRTPNMVGATAFKFTYSASGSVASEAHARIYYADELGNINYDKLMYAGPTVAKNQTDYATNTIQLPQVYNGECLSVCIYCKAVPGAICSISKATLAFVTVPKPTSTAAPVTTTTTAPVTTTAAPVTTTGAPVTTTAAPVTTTTAPVPVTTTGVPVTTTGVPVTTTGMPVTAAPVTAAPVILYTTTTTFTPMTTTSTFAPSTMAATVYSNSSPAAVTLAPIYAVTETSEPETPYGESTSPVAESTMQPAVQFTSTYAPMRSTSYSSTYLPTNMPMSSLPSSAAAYSTSATVVDMVSSEPTSSSSSPGYSSSTVVPVTDSSSTSAPVVISDETMREIETLAPVAPTVLAAATQGPDTAQFFNTTNLAVAAAIILFVVATILVYKITTGQSAPMTVPATLARA